MHEGLDIQVRKREFSPLFERFPALGRFRRALGKTRLISIPGVPGGARIFAKCEMENPVGSNKDRTAYALLAPVLHRTPDSELGRLKILESEWPASGPEYSGGNLARALGKLCYELEIPLRLVLPEAAPPSLIELLKRWGSDVRLVDTSAGRHALFEETQRLATDLSWTFLDQHHNQANVDFQAETMGAEIVSQLGSRPDAWVASIGTGGTLIGVARALRKLNPELAVYGCTFAETPYGAGRRERFVEQEGHMISGHRHCTQTESLRAMAAFYDLTGLRIGSTAAANWLVSREIARTLPASATVVTVFPCSGSPEEWLRARWNQEPRRSFWLNAMRDNPYSG
jgi:cysteine synthase A